MQYVYRPGHDGGYGYDCHQGGRDRKKRPGVDFLKGQFVPFSASWRGKGYASAVCGDFLVWEIMVYPSQATTDVVGFRISSYSKASTSMIMHDHSFIWWFGRFSFNNSWMWTGTMQLQIVGGRISKTWNSPCRKILATPGTPFYK